MIQQEIAGPITRVRRFLQYFFLCSFPLFGFSQTTVITWNGTVYNNETVSEMITVITSTSPLPSMPSTKYLYAAQKSLSQVRSLAKCRKIIVFDGLKEDQKSLSQRYEEYKKNIEQLVRTDPYFSNTKLVFCERWEHLSGAIRKAIAHVETPFLFIHQHDLLLLKEFDLNGVVASMAANPDIKYVYLGRRPNTPDDFYHGPVDEWIEGTSFVPLCRSCGWSDQCHIASVDYYLSFVLPQCDHVFMENVLHPKLKKALRQSGMSGRKLFGTYLYGHLSEGPYILHMDGRNNQ